MTMNAEALYHEAQKLNSDLGRHVRQCSFSTQLSGRFYENNSMESHKARARRIQQMKAKRLALERSLIMEKKKIEWLEAKLHEKRELKRQEEERRLLMERAAIRIQTFVRMVLAKNTLEVRRVERAIQNYIALFLQSRYRGWRDRVIVRQLRMDIAIRKMEQMASIRIQTIWRGEIAKNELKRRQQILQQTQCNAITRIQACTRGVHGRNQAKSRKRNMAAIKIQCMYRVVVARRILQELREMDRRKREEHRRKRIPLHKRRYSTYAGLPNAAGLAEIGRVRTSTSTRRNNNHHNHVHANRRMTNAVNMVMAVNALRTRTAAVRGLDIVRDSQKESAGRRRRGSGTTCTDTSTLQSTYTSCTAKQQGGTAVAASLSNASSSQKDTVKSAKESVPTTTCTCGSSSNNSGTRIHSDQSSSSSSSSPSPSPSSSSSSPSSSTRIDTRACNLITNKDEDTAVSESISISTATVENNDSIEEKNRQSRYRAAMRAAKLKREKELSKEQKLQHAQARKEVLGKLEAKRRDLMDKEKLEATKKRRNMNKLSSSSLSISRSKKEEEVLDTTTPDHCGDEQNARKPHEQTFQGEMTIGGIINSNDETKANDSLQLRRICQCHDCIKYENIDKSMQLRSSLNAGSSSVVYTTSSSRTCSKHEQETILSYDDRQAMDDGDDDIFEDYCGENEDDLF